DYGYNGKELQNDLINNKKPDCYDYGARMYDPQLGRWHVVDPLAFKYSALSPYCYVGNRPIISIDPDGREIVIVGPNKEQTYNDLTIIYATPMGRQIIEALHNSSNVYKIGGGGWFPTSSSYSPFWNRRLIIKEMRRLGVINTVLSRCLDMNCIMHTRMRRVTLKDVQSLVLKKKL
ncbi:MAG TPA: RHS repeat-associated core domain-containing protein, partial [Saprospiraceae bacterium]|nr:RHS repeat-associated core domain-containing protein [Saprospiraceae bacterium]